MMFITIIVLITQADFLIRMADHGSVNALCGYFDVQFAGSPENPADTPVTLSTAPDPTGATHWGQQVFFLYPDIPVKPGWLVVGVCGCGGGCIVVGLGMCVN